MLRLLHIIMPMAGKGSRFMKEGWTTPKQMGNDKWQMTNIEDSISNPQSPITIVKRSIERNYDERRIS